jgi:hypothetical protein
MRNTKFFVKSVVKLAITAGLCLSLSSFAEDPQDDAAFTCASAVNVMDCIKQTGAGVNAPIQESNLSTSANSIIQGSANQALKLSGPLSAAIRYDNYLAWIMDVGYAQEFYNAAAAFKLSAGLNELRANVTLGYSITPKQQIKLTYEYLSQNLPFDYASGKVNEWVNQNAFGAAYRYMLDFGILRALEVYGTYTKASNKELSEVEMYTDNLLTQINYRRIAGGTETVGGANITLTPFKSTVVKVGGGYSTLNFDTKWENSTDTTALVYNAEISHLLTPKTMITTGIGNTASGRTHTAKFSQILPWDLEASVLGQYTATTNDIPKSIGVGAALSYPAPKTYTNVFAGGLSKLKDWVEKPVIYHARVLAKAEEKLVAVAITTSAIPAQPVLIGNSIVPIQTQNYFSYPAGVYNKITYSILPITITASNQPANTDLNLTVIPVDSFNATIQSTAPTTQAMMPAGQSVDYTVTIQAQGYRNGAVVTQQNNTVHFTVQPNTGLGAATWVANPPPLPAASPSTTYNSNNPIFLNDKKYITPALPSGEDFHFEIINGPTWIKLTSSDPNAVNQSLIANGSVSSDLLAPSTVTLKATSKASGLVANPETGGILTIPVANASLQLPNWVSGINSMLLPAQQAAPYALPLSKDNAPTVLDPYSPNSGGYVSKTVVNDQPDPSDTVTFSKANGPSSCDWLSVSPDGTLSGSVPLSTPVGKCFVYINALSAHHSNGVPTLMTIAKAPTGTVPTIQINTVQYTFPTWTTAILPTSGVLNGQPATYVLKGDTYPETVLNPYDNNALYMTIMKQNNQPLNQDTLSFSINTDVNKYDTPCQWLSFSDGSGTNKTQDSPTGTLTATSADKTCKLWLNIHSETANSAQDVLTAPTINVLTLPAWITPPTGWSSGATTTSPAINPYTGNSGFLTKTTNGITTINDEVLQNFEVVHGGENDCTWLDFTDHSKGVLSGTAPFVSQTATCNLTIKFDSKFKTGYQLAATQITINTSGAPSWKQQSGYVITMNYVSANKVTKVAGSTSDADAYPIDNTNQYYMFTLASALNDPASQLDFSNLSRTTNLPAGNISTAIVVAPTYGSVAEIKPAVDDIDNRPVNDTSNKSIGKFTVQAAKSGGSSSTGTFLVQVTASLANPTPKSGVTLPAAIPGQTYTLDLNPYSNANSPLSKTTVATETTSSLSSDSLTFAVPNPTTIPNPDTACTWLFQENALKPDGKISATVDDSSLNTCYLWFTVTSAKNNGVSNLISIPVPSGVNTPDWSNVPATMNMKFDQTSVVTGTNGNNVLDLTAMQGTGAQENLTFRLDPALQQNNWRVYPNPTDGHYYLVRQVNPFLNGGTFDAGTVGNTESVVITAANYKEPTGTSYTLGPITINPDSNVSVAVPTPFTLTTMAGTQASVPLWNPSNTPGSNALQSSVNATFISNDTITVNSGPTDGAIVTSPAPNNTVIAYYDQPSYSVVIPASLISKDLGTYSNGTLKNVLSTAKGAAIATVPLPYTFNITAASSWNPSPLPGSTSASTPGHIKFSDTTGGFLLYDPADAANSLVNAGYPTSSLTITVKSATANTVTGPNTSTANNWKTVTTTGGKIYLVRSLTNNGATVDAGDVYTSTLNNPTTITLTASNGAGAPQDQQFTAYVDPEVPANVELYWTGQSTYTYFAGDKTVGLNGTDYIAAFNFADRDSTTATALHTRLTGTQIRITGDILKFTVNQTYTADSCYVNMSSNLWQTPGGTQMYLQGNSNVVAPACNVGTGSLVIPVGEMQDQAAGDYLGTALRPNAQFYSTAAQAYLTPQIQNLTVTILKSIAWTSASDSIKYNQTSVSRPGDSTSLAINLTNKVTVPSNIPSTSSLRFEFQSPQDSANDNWQIIPPTGSDTNWYLARKTRPNAQVGDYIDATDGNNQVDTTVYATVKLQACVTNTNSCSSGTGIKTQTLTVTVLPDPANTKIYWMPSTTATLALPNQDAVTYPLYDQNNPFGTNGASTQLGILTTTSDGRYLRVKDLLKVRCTTSNTADDAKVGNIKNDSGGSVTAVYVTPLNSNASNACRYTMFNVIKRNMNSTPDQVLYQGSNPDDQRIVFVNVTSNAMGYQTSYTLPVYPNPNSTFKIRYCNNGVNANNTACK